MSLVHQTLLLKTKSYPIDPYDTLFSSRNFNPIFIPVLQHRSINLGLVEALITDGKIKGLSTTGNKADGQKPKYGAIIITSQRAVEALGATLTSLQGKFPSFSPQSSTITIYVVGSATKKAVENLGFPTANVQGANCGNGDILSDFITTHYRSIVSPSKGKESHFPNDLLFFVGETRHDVIPRKLKAVGLGVDEIVVYDTEVVQGFGDHFMSLVKPEHRVLGNSMSRSVRWVVIFSPAGSDKAMEILGRSSSGRCDGGCQFLSKPVEQDYSVAHTYVATIGPTTAAHLRSVLGVEPDAVARKPSPEGLLQAIEEFMDGKIVRE